MKRPIAISLSPNSEKDDVFLSLKLLLSPISWFDFRLTDKLEREFASLFGKDYRALAVNSGRSAEYLILKALGIGAGDEVIVQGFTCVAVPNSVLWLEAKPIYADIGEDFNIDPVSLKKQLTKKTKAVIVQHSFGIPADMNKIGKVIKGKKISLIEDCALSLGALVNGKKVGTLGDISFFSFGRDKVISSVFGGMILTKDKKIYQKLIDERYKLDYPSAFWVAQQLMHPVLFAIILPLYNIGSGRFTLGKSMLYLFQRIGLLSRAVYKEETIGKRSKLFPKRMPGALAKLAINQLTKLARFNTHRKNIAEYYYKSFKNTPIVLPPDKKGAIWMRFPILSFKRERILRYAKNRGILLGDWYTSPVVPVTDLNWVNYNPLSCINAEKMSRVILNLPTYPTMTLDDAGIIVKLTKKCLNLK